MPLATGRPKSAAQSGGIHRHHPPRCRSGVKTVCAQTGSVSTAGHAYCRQLFRPATAHQPQPGQAAQPENHRTHFPQARQRDPSPQMLVVIAHPSATGAASTAHAATPASLPRKTRANVATAIWIARYWWKPLPSAVRRFLKLPHEPGAAAAAPTTAICRNRTSWYSTRPCRGYGGCCAYQRARSGDCTSVENSIDC